MLYYGGYTRRIGGRKRIHTLAGPGWSSSERPRLMLVFFLFRNQSLPINGTYTSDADFHRC
jgi:hypothetical protein